MLALMALVNFYFSNFVSRDAKHPKVNAMPAPSVPSATAQPAYDGPHPMHWTRPQDPFVYPIAIGKPGPVAPVYAGPLQYPFLCGVRASGFGQPLIDNQDGYGVPVFQEDPDTGEPTHVVVGYSKNCSMATEVQYYYNEAGTDNFLPWSAALSLDDPEIELIEVDGKVVPFIVRMEIGTINRFFYAIAALKGPNEMPRADDRFSPGNASSLKNSPLSNSSSQLSQYYPQAAEYLEQPDATYWNGRLVYQFRGGVGIGKRQGKLNPRSVLSRRKAILSAGYAVAYSTGNQTSNHYNLWLAEETALRVKRQFTARYGEPSRTLGIGGSGGAIQQLVIAQNNTGLLDGALALYGYPDMITQTIYAFDCELLEYYFDVTAQDNRRWQDWPNRSLVQGLNSVDDFSNKFTPYYTLARMVWGVWPPAAEGMSECINGWRGLTQLTNNPHFTHLAKYYNPDVLANTHWTHWDDLRHIYGVRDSGFARQTWDNVGVQYGLLALQQGQLSPEEFLHLNHHVGGWKPPEAFRQERYWKIVMGATLFEFSPWSHHNMWLTGSERPAPRTHGDKKAIEAVFQSGHVFMGKADIPILDMRHYLEAELDMHHLSASFSIRRRMQDFYGHADHHVMWVMEKPHEPVLEAMQALDKWVQARQSRADNDLWASKPADLRDTCFDGEGNVVAQGDTVWDGEWNDKPAGRCSQAYPFFRTSRIVAGSDWQGDVFKCQLKPVRQALAEGDYGERDMTPYLADLERVFPQGVCDYTKTSAAKKSVLEQLRQPL